MHRIATRLISASARPGRFVKSCPEPEFFTHCTLCEPSLPEELQIDFSKPLRGTAARPWKQLLILTGQNAASWPSRLEMSPGSVVGEFQPLRRKLCSPYHPVLASNTSLPGVATDGNFSAILYPDNKLFGDLGLSQLNEFTIAHLTPEGETEEQLSIQRGLREKYTGVDNVNDLILICGHAQRDQRCGVIAPLLQDEFTTVLRQKGLLYDAETNPKGIKVGMISHIGGHAYAGNVLYFRGSGEPIVYGRVFPKNVQGIIKETIENGNIIEEFYRG